MSRLDYEAVLAGLPDAVLGVDEGLRIVLWNPAAEALLGRSARRALGRTLKEVFPPETSLIRHLSDTLTTGESRSESEAVVEGADGRPVHVSIVTAPMAGRSGAVTAAVAVVRDVTRLHQLEAEMRRGETLTAAGQIAMGLAHEIRNPLGAIRGAVQLLKRELGDEARWGEYIAVLLKEVDRVNRIIEMLLDLGRPVTLRPVPLNIHQLLERVALMSEEVAAERATWARASRAWPWSRWRTRARASPRPRVSSSSPRSSRPRTRGSGSDSPSAIASWRSTRAPSTSRASPARGRSCHASSRSRARAMIRAHLLRWRACGTPQRTGSTPRGAAALAALQLDPSHRSSL